MELECKNCVSFKHNYCFFHLRKMKEWELCPDWELCPNLEENYENEL